MDGIKTLCSIDHDRSLRSQLKLQTSLANLYRQARMWFCLVNAIVTAHVYACSQLQLGLPCRISHACLLSSCMCD